MPVVIALLIWPLIEIALFVTLGGWLGLWLTLGIVLGTAFAGVMLMRWRGLRAIADLRGQMKAMGNPLALAADQAVFMLAGVLLILPGFLTDIMGALLLISPVRTALVAVMARRVMVARTGVRPASDVIDGDYSEITPPEAPRPAPSGWTQH
jgi:UPF0716 protein FxsA